METFGADARRLLRQASAAMNVLINFCNFLLQVKKVKGFSYMKEVINECLKAIGQNSLYYSWAYYWLMYYWEGRPKTTNCALFGVGDVY